MLPNILSIKKIRSAWEKHARALNAAAPLQQRKRLNPDGTVTVYQVRKKVVPDGVLNTGRELVYFYVKAYEEALKSNINLAPGQLPSFWTNGTLFGKRMSVSGRTMRSRMAVLQKVGFITKTGHGSRHDYELWINPQFLFTEEKMAEFTRKNAFANCTASPPQRKDFPHNVSCDTTSNYEKETSNVDKKGVAEQAPLQVAGLPGPQRGAMPVGDGKAGNAGNTNAGNTGAQSAGKRLRSKLYGGLTAEKHATGAGGAAAAISAAQQAEFEFYVKNFWLYAWQMLYPGEEFDDTDQQLAMDAIRSGVFCDFKPDWSAEKWEKYFHRVKERVDLARTYFLNHPEKYPPKPWAQWVTGTGYFDRENTRGFAATHAWQLRNDKWRKDTMINFELRRARVDIRKHTKGQARKRLQEKSPMQLYKFYENKFRALGYEALQLFYREMAPPKTNHLSN